MSDYEIHFYLGRRRCWICTPTEENRTLWEEYKRAADAAEVVQW